MAINNWIHWTADPDKIIVAIRRGAGEHRSYHKGIPVRCNGNALGADCRHPGYELRRANFLQDLAFILFLLALCQLLIQF
jgi:hypothetical protein